MGNTLIAHDLSFLPDARYAFGVLHVTSVAFSFASLFVSAIVFNDIEERAVDPVDRDGRTRTTLVVHSRTASKHQGCQMAKFDPFLSLDCARVEGVGAQSKERKGSNFAA